MGVIVKLNIVLAAAATIVSQTALAKTVVTQLDTYTKEVKVFESLAFNCRPGIPPNGHNFPTTSTVNIGIFDIPASNITHVYTNGPRDLAFATGNHCDELAERLRQNIPGILNITRTFEERCAQLGGQTLKSITETVLAELGEFKFHGSQSMIVGQCKLEE